jgi:hypothetical protein
VEGRNEGVCRTKSVVRQSPIRPSAGLALFLALFLVLGDWVSAHHRQRQDGRIASVVLFLFLCVLRGRALLGVGRYVVVWSGPSAVAWRGPFK